MYIYIYRVVIIGPKRGGLIIGPREINYKVLKEGPGGEGLIVMDPKGSAPKPV